MSASSINTNQSALKALQAVSAASRELAVARSRVATGLKVERPVDDGAVWAVAQKQRAEMGGWRAVDASLSRGQSALDIGLAGTEAISDLLVELKALAVAYADASLTRDRAAIRADMDALISQIDQIAHDASFDGISLLTGRETMLTESTWSYRLPPSPLPPGGFSIPMAALPPGSGSMLTTGVTHHLPPGSLTPPSFNGALSEMSGSNTQTVSVDAGSSPGRVSLLLDAFGAPDVLEIWQGGVRVAATGRASADGGAPVGAGQPVSHLNVLSFDYDPANGQTLEFRFNENADVSGTVWQVGGLIMGEPGSGTPDLVPTYAASGIVWTAGEFEIARDHVDPEEAARSFGLLPQAPARTTTVNGGPVAGRVDMVFDAFGLPDTLEVFQGGVRIGATGQAYSPGGGAVGGAVPVTGQTVVSFDYDPARGAVSFVFNGGGHDPANAWAVGAVTLQPHGAPLPGPDSGVHSWQTPGYGPRHYDFLLSAEGDTTRVTSRDLTARGLSLNRIDWSNPRGVLDMIERAAALVLDASVYFGTRSRLFDASLAHAAALSDALTKGVGNLVDADMAREAARLEAGRIRQELAVQTLAIANAAPGALLGLFGR